MKEIDSPKYTKKLYWHDTYLFECNSMVIDKGEDSKNGHWVRLDATIFRPQGGGQPSDFGEINGIKVTKLEESRLEEEVDYDLGIITHYLERNPEVNIGETVSLKIDHEKRLTHSALHTAGHIVAGILRTDYGYQKQTGANHFEKQAKVEFKLDGNSFKFEDLLEKSRSIVNEGREVNASFQEAPDIYKAPNRNPYTRCVTIQNLWTEPCSGTHVKNTNEIAGLSLRNSKAKKGDISVGYNASYCSFFSDKEEKSISHASEIPLVQEGQILKEITSSNGAKIIFFYKEDSIRARVQYHEDERPKEYSDLNIYINLNNSPDKTILFSKKNLSWKLSTLQKIKEVSLAFSGDIVITELEEAELINNSTVKLG